VARYQDDYMRVFPDKNNLIDERNELLGQYSLDYAALKEKVQQNDTGIVRFSKALYASDKKFILTGEDREKCNEMSLEYLDKWLKESNISAEDVVWNAPKANDETLNYFSLYANQGKKFRAKMVINPTGELLDNLYSPVGCNIIHETQHMMQVDFKAKSNYSDYTAELGPTLYSLMVNDEIYKKIHGIDLQEQVNYGNIYISDGNPVAIGEIANRFREVVQKHPSKSVDKIVAEPEMMQQMAKWGAYSDMYKIMHNLNQR
jgi:hypothetical protein